MVTQTMDSNNDPELCQVIYDIVNLGPKERTYVFHCKYKRFTDDSHKFTRCPTTFMYIYCFKFVILSNTLSNTLNIHSRCDSKF